MEKNGNWQLATGIAPPAYEWFVGFIRHNYSEVNPRSLRTLARAFQIIWQHVMAGITSQASPRSIFNT
jgi:hypothetical protein